MKSHLTILIPTSPIPLHPSTAVIDDCIGKLREQQEIKDCEIIIMMDGVHKNHEAKRENYLKYKDNLTENISAGKYGNCWIRSFTDHTHQANMTLAVLQEVKTPYVMFVEHDTAPINEIHWEKIFEVMDTYNTVNYVRFHIFHEFLKEHDYLMLGMENYNGLPLMRTIQWSQRPHVARKEWYIEILNRYFSGNKTMIEDVMHGICQDKYYAEKKDVFGMFIYAPDGLKLRSYHADGRGEDEKIIEG